MREKQISEMAEVIDHTFFIARRVVGAIPSAKMIATDLYEKDYRKQGEGEWFLLDECANEGVYCSVCHKKVYRKEYANQKVKSRFCPNCGAHMSGGKTDE